MKSLKKIISSRQSKPKQQSRQIVVVRPKPSSRQRRNVPRLTRRVTQPLASSRTNKTWFSVRSASDPTSLLVSGRDLVTSIPITLADQENRIFSVFSINPISWSGTRLSAIALAYQNYRPTKLKIHYTPQVSASTDGTVIVGTVWSDEGLPYATMDKMLATSNGGMMSPVYHPFTTEVRLATNLQYNLYKTFGPSSELTQPFYVMAICPGCDKVPGYFSVEYEYLLKNPLGKGGDSFTSEPMPFSQFSDFTQTENISAQFITPAVTDEQTFNPGTKVNLDNSGSIIYEGSLLKVENDPVTIFSGNSSSDTEVSQLSLLFKGYSLSPITTRQVDWSTSSSNAVYLSGYVAAATPLYDIVNRTTPVYGAYLFVTFSFSTRQLIVRTIHPLNAMSGNGTTPFLVDSTHFQFGIHDITIPADSIFFIQAINAIANPNSLIATTTRTLYSQANGRLVATIDLSPLKLKYDSLVMSTDFRVWGASSTSMTGDGYNVQNQYQVPSDYYLYNRWFSVTAFTYHLVGPINLERPTTSRVREISPPSPLQIDVSSVSSSSSSSSSKATSFKSALSRLLELVDEETLESEPE